MYKFLFISSEETTGLDPKDEEARTHQDGMNQEDPTKLRSSSKGSDGPS